MLARNISIFYKAFFKEKSIQEQVYTVIQAAIKCFFFSFYFEVGQIWICYSCCNGHVKLFN